MLLHGVCRPATDGSAHRRRRAQHGSKGQRLLHAEVSGPHRSHQCQQDSSVEPVDACRLLRGTDGPAGHRSAAALPGLRPDVGRLPPVDTAQRREHLRCRRPVLRSDLRGAATLYSQGLQGTARERHCQPGPPDADTQYEGADRHAQGQDKRQLALWLVDVDRCHPDGHAALRAGLFADGRQAIP